MYVDVMYVLIDANWLGCYCAAAAARFVLLCYSYVHDMMYPVCYVNANPIYCVTGIFH